MKFVEVEINGKKYYEKVEDDFDTAENNAENTEEKVENKEKCDESPEKEEDFIGENALRRFCRDFVDGAKDFTDGAIKWTRRVADNVGDFFVKITTPSKTEKLIKMLPHMDEEDIHEIVIDILKDEESLRELNIEELLPFLSEQDCDSLFILAIRAGNKKLIPSNIAPFVSKECLSQVVDEYIDGKYQGLDIDSLYQFLSSKDIKRVFYHTMSKEGADNSAE